MTSLDHINPTEREAALIEQYNKALATVASVAKEREKTFQSNECRSLKEFMNRSPSGKRVK